VKVLFVATEAHFTGGAGEVGVAASKLAPALNNLGADCRVVIPMNEKISLEYAEKIKLVATFSVPVSWRVQFCGVYELEHGGVKHYIIDNQDHFGGETAFSDVHAGHHTEACAFFSRAVLEMLPAIDFKPDVMHTNDTQTALVSVFWRVFYSHSVFYSDIKHVFTIHDYNYQGVMSPEMSHDVIGLPEWAEGIIRYDDVRILIKGAIETAHSVVIADSSYGEWRESPHICDKWDKITIIPNGAESDGDHVDMNKSEYKMELQKLFGFKQNKTNPLVAAVISDSTMEHDCAFALGALTKFYSYQPPAARKVSCVVTGPAAHRGYVIERANEFIRHLEHDYPGKEVVHCRELSLITKIIAGADICIIPSYRHARKITAFALRHGTIPVVFATGGPFDIVTDASNQKGYGFVFDEPKPSALMGALERAIAAYQDTKKWSGIADRAGACDFSWDNVTAADYLKLYSSLCP